MPEPGENLLERFARLTGVAVETLQQAAEGAAPAAVPAIQENVVDPITSSVGRGFVQALAPGTNAVMQQVEGATSAPTQAPAQATPDQRLLNALGPEMALVAARAATPVSQFEDGRAADMSFSLEEAGGRGAVPPAGSIGGGDLVSRSPEELAASQAISDLRAEDLKGGEGKPQAIDSGDITRFESGGMETFQQRADTSVQQGNELASTLAAIEDEVRTADLKSVERQFAVAEAQRVRLEEMDRQITQLRETRFDADRLFAGADGATRFGAHLGIAVGHMLQIRNNILFPGSNTPNDAMRIINDAIDRDIRTQITQHQQGLNVLAQQRTAMGLAREIGLTEAGAEEFAREKILESVQREMTTLAFRHRGTQQALVFNQMANQYGLQRAELARANEIAMQQLAMQSAQGAGASVDRTLNPAPAWIRIMNGPEFANLWGQLESGQRSKITEEGAAATALVTTLDTLQDDVARLSSMSITNASLSEASARIRTRVFDAMMQYKQATGAGALDAGLIKLFANILNDPTELRALSGRFNARANELRATVNERMNARVLPLVQPGAAASVTPAMGSTRMPGRENQADVETAGGRIAQIGQDATQNFVFSAMSGGTVPPQLLPGASFANADEETQAMVEALQASGTEVE